MEDVGFVLGDVTRKTLFLDIAAGEPREDKLLRKHHIPAPRGERALDELVERGLIEKMEFGYAVTDEGQKVLSELRRGGGRGKGDPGKQDKRAAGFKPNHWN